MYWIFTTFITAVDSSGTILFNTGTQMRKPPDYNELFSSPRSGPVSEKQRPPSGGPDNAPGDLPPMPPAYYTMHNNQNTSPEPSVPPDTTYCGANWQTLLAACSLSFLYAYL